jgi:hypothetical protein
MFLSFPKVVCFSKNWVKNRKEVRVKKEGIFAVTANSYCGRLKPRDSKASNISKAG